MPAEQKHFADRLQEAVRRKGSPVCVGLDPSLDKLPADLPGVSQDASPAARVRAFCRGVIDAVASIVPAVKPQIAYFEQLGPEGLTVYREVTAMAHEAGLVVIGDAKRGDIGSTASAYATAHFAASGAVASGNTFADALTVNGYFGADGVQPFVDAARQAGGGVFVLVRTSNPGGAPVQDFPGADGEPFYKHMARLVAAWGDADPADSMLGQSGYSLVGAVVGATYPDEARQLRRVMPRQIFLVPGYGAQGASAADCAAAFDGNGQGAIVNASRSVIYAHLKDSEGPWQSAVERAARRFAADIAEAVGR